MLASPDLERMREYWEALGHTYLCPDMVGRRIVSQHLRLLKPRSLVEIGCGHGALFRYYQDIPDVVGLDWSSSMLERALERCERRGYRNIQVYRADITESESLRPWRDRRFDVALTRTCLMHIPPDRIEQACMNVASLSDRLLIFEYFEEHPRPLSEHNWLHDYVGLFTALNYRLVESFERGGIPQVLFHFTQNSYSE